MILSDNRHFGPGASGSQPGKASGRDLKPAMQPSPLGRGRMNGQAAVIIAFSMLFLLLVVGMAVDGGSTYNQRRVAQNSADAVALAGTQVMLSSYQAMVLASDYDVDGTADEERTISSTISTYASLHGIARSDLQAYYVNDDKQVVSTAQVGSYDGIPFSLGAKGITIKNSSQTDSYIMKLIGWDKVKASASSTAFMGVAVDSSGGFGVPLIPVGFFTQTQNILNLVPGRTYTLMDKSVSLGSGNWGWVSFNGDGNANVNVDWINCGFNPSVDADHWTEWCPGGTYHAAGPTKHYLCGDHPDCTTIGDEIRVPYLKWGVGDTGWWLEGTTGDKASDCHELRDQVHVNQEYFIPMIDQWTDEGGQNMKYHLAAVGKFLITSGDLDCNGSGFFINGMFEQYTAAGGSGHHGDLRHASGQTVFLEN